MCWSLGIMTAASPSPAPDRWHRTDRHSDSADRLVVWGVCRVWPIGAQGHSSDPAASRLATRSQWLWWLQCRSSGRRSVVGEVFLKASITFVFCLGCCGRGAHVGEAQIVQELGDVALTVDDPKSVPQSPVSDQHDASEQRRVFACPDRSPQEPPMHPTAQPTICTQTRCPIGPTAPQDQPR